MRASSMHRLEQRRIDPGVDLDEIGAGVDQTVHRLAGVAGGVGAESVGISRGQAVDHGAGAVDPGAGHRAEIHFLVAGRRMVSSWPCTSRTVVTPQAR